jgi:CxxC motif-containing protein
MNKDFICIVCPNSCRLSVTEEGGTITVQGHECPRGREHGIREYSEPVRMLTTTIVVQEGTLQRLPVISTAEIPKAKLGECLEVLYKTEVSAPIKCGDVIVENICDTGTDVVASRSLTTIQGA